MLPPEKEHGNGKKTPFEDVFRVQKLGFSNVIFKNTLGRDMFVPRRVAFYELLTDLMRGS